MTEPDLAAVVGIYGMIMALIIIYVILVLPVLMKEHREKLEQSFEKAKTELIQNIIELERRHSRNGNSQEENSKEVQED